MRIPWSIASPSLVLVQQSIAYALVPWSCARQTAAPLHALLAATAAVILFGLFTSWHRWRGGRVGKEADAQGGVTEARADFTVALDAMLSLVSLLVVVAQWIGVFVLSPCH